MRSISLSPLVAATAVLAAAAVALASTADADDGPAFCLFRRCTGGYCPGCGGSRATVALFRGDLTRSWATHPWVPLLAAQLLVLGAIVATGGTTRVRPLLVPILIGNLMLGVGIWALRIAGGDIPVPFG